VRNPSVLIRPSRYKRKNGLFGEILKVSMRDIEYLNDDNNSPKYPKKRCDTLSSQKIGVRNENSTEICKTGCSDR
jgi:hypothetical protein